MERFLKVVMLILSAWLILNHAATSALGSSECQERCGDISIPPPFGIKQGCYRSLGFRLICNDSTGSNPKLFLAHNDEAARTLEVREISLSGSPQEPYGPYVRVQYYPVAFMNAGTTVSSFPWRALQDSPFAFSSGVSFVAAGCDVTAYLMDLNRTTVVATCAATCNCKDDITPFMDENYNSCTAKVADFGASRTLPLDQTHVTTLVQGTFGYLDPEYYQTSQLTEKSDVYSFGVILVELLTGEKPISSARCPDEINLGSRFLLARQGKRFFQLLEARVKEEGSEEELGTIATLAEMCLQLRGGERPTMKEVEAILEGLRRSKNQKRHTTNEPSNCHHYELVHANSEGSSRIFSLEKEFISSLDWPR